MNNNSSVYNSNNDARSRSIAPTIVVIISVVLIAAICVMMYMFFGLDKDAVSGAIAQNGGTSSIWGDPTLCIDARVDEELQNYRNIVFFGLDVERMDRLEEAKKSKDYYKIKKYIKEFENESFPKGDLDKDDLAYDSDAAVVFSYNQKTKGMKIFSIYRDTYVQMDNDGGLGRISSCFAPFDIVSDGMYNNICAINRNLDLNIREAVVFDWSSVRKLIDGIGGVELDVDADSIAFINEYVNKRDIIHKKPGKMKLNANQMEFYLRYYRDPHSADVKRNKHIIEIFNYVFTEGQKMDKEKMMKLWDEVYSMIYTNMSKNTITEFLMQPEEMVLDEKQIWPYEYKNWSAITNTVYVVPFSLTDNVREMHKRMFEQEKYKPTSRLKGISAKIERFSGFYK